MVCYIITNKLSGPNVPGLLTCESTRGEWQQPDLNERWGKVNEPVEQERHDPEED